MKKRILSIVTCLAMVLSMLPTAAFAAEDTGLCAHHTEHTAECHYAEAVTGADCTHVHDETCGYVEAVEEVLCACEATDETGAQVHTEGCGYVAPVAGSDCTHTHDDSCGYIAAVEAHPCHYECAVCTAQELIDALPDEVTAENADAVAAHLDAIDMAKAELTPDELALLDLTKYTAAAQALGALAAAEVTCTCETKCAEDAINHDCPVCAAEGAGLTACTGEEAPAAPVCDCGTDDALIHATTCAVYVAPENPVCDCAEKCTEVNEWCDVCGFDYTACTGTDRAVGYAEGDVASVTTGAGTVNYERLTEAIEAAKANSGATLKLLKDIGTNVCIDGGTFTFDLNGHTIEADTKFDGVEPYTNQFAMNILSGADITLIGSGSIISNGPDDPSYTTWLYCIRNLGTLTVNGPMQIRTNGYTYNSGIYSYGGTLTIHDCNIEVSRYAVEGNSGAQVTINGGSFAGDIGVYGGGSAAVNINGGTVTGSSCDVFISDNGGLASVKLGIGSGGVGLRFPGGLSINNRVGLSALLNPNYYYMKNGNPVDMTGITTEILDGDVSVGYCDHSSNINGVPVADDATNHSLFCSICEVKIRQEQHSLLDGICTDCGYGCSHPDVVTVNGVVKCAACPVVMVAQVGDSYYARLSDAVAQANAVNGRTLTLLSDVKGDIVVDPGSSFTLDLNGKTLRGTGKSVITIGASGGSAASLIMKSSAGGGKVTGCYHQDAKGTVVVNSWSTFTMESGTISGNVAYFGGGVYVAGGTFNMKGGEISGNTADMQGGGVLLVGTSASFTMDGGSIRSNTVTIDDKNREMEGIYGGGGVYVDSGTFTMNAGTISGNSSTYTRGGGVQVAQGTFVMNGGTIEGNSAAEKGGGVYVMKGENGDPSGTFTVGGSSVITGNTVNGSANNVYLAVPLTIGSNLSPDANIGVTASAEPTETVNVEIASSGATDANKAAFISDNDAYSVIRTDNKLYLYLHIHNWVYELDGSDTIKATCHAADCSRRNGDGGSIRLVVQNAHYTGAAIGATIEGSLTTGAVYKITYNDGSETAPSTAGKHRATLTVTENGVQKQSVSIEYVIKAATGGGGGGGYTPSTPPAQSVTVPISGDANTIHVGVSVSGKTATIDHVDLSALHTVIGDHVENIGVVTIAFSVLDVEVDTVAIPADVVKQIADAVNDPNNDAESLEIVLTDGTSIEFDAVALGEKAAQADGLDITISIEHHDDAALTSAQKDAVGDRVAYDINVTSGGEHISDMGGKITVHAPYELKKGEKGSGIVVWYVDEHGSRERCETSYDNAKKRVNWKTDHLSLYMIDYDESFINPFTDISEDKYYYDAVLWAVDKGITNGSSATTFSPDASCTRAQMATFLWRAAGSPDPVGSTNPFTDVSADAYYAKAVQWAYEQGITGGTSATAFSPEADCTRGQMATFLWRNAGSPATAGSANPFTDVSESAYYAKAVQWAYEQGITGGTSATAFSPEADCTRGQMVTFLYRCFGK